MGTPDFREKGGHFSRPPAAGRIADPADPAAGPAVDLADPADPAAGLVAGLAVAVDLAAGPAAGKWCSSRH